MRNARSTKNDYTRIKLKKLVDEMPIDSICDSRTLASTISTLHREVKPRTIGNLMRELDNVVLVGVAYTWKKIQKNTGDATDMRN